MTQSLEHARQLLDFTKVDPQNTALLLDAATACLDADLIDDAEALIEQHKSVSKLDERGRYLAGMIAMRQGDYIGAEGVFEGLMQQGETASSLVFNRAWSLSHLKRYDEALNLLSQTVTDELGQAAMLRVQLLHQLGQFEDAGEFARESLDKHSDHPGLNAAISVLALDIEDRDLAFATASKAGDHLDAKTTLATLALGEAELDIALETFDRIIAQNETIPRSWIGRGLTKLAMGEHGAAASDLDKGAALFGSHLGSWIAAGWAYFVQNNYQMSRERFETALSIDPTFSEIHGSLAVISVVEGDLDAARELTRKAKGLDPECFSAALAQSLILSSQGKTEIASQIVETALKTPVDKDGRTISDMLIKMGLS